jgi:hypothetical protein
MGFKRPQPCMGEKNILSEHIQQNGGKLDGLML